MKVKMPNVVEGVVGAIFAVFIGWVVISALITAMPGFAAIGIVLLLAIVLMGIAAVMKVFR